MTEAQRRADLLEFYRILSDLQIRHGGARYLKDCNGKLDWPERGVYFFFEKGENRSKSDQGLRVTRVGTHALSATSRTSLWNRLSQHRGAQNTGGGNHRGSVFRKLVGSAMIAKDRHLSCSTWGQGNSATSAIRKSEQ